MRSWHLPTPVDTSTPNNALTEGACARNHIALRRRPQLERRTRVSTQQHTRSVRSLAASFQSARPSLWPRENSSSGSSAAYFRLATRSGASGSIVTAHAARKLLRLWRLGELQTTPAAQVAACPNRRRPQAYLLDLPITGQCASAARWRTLADRIQSAVGQAR